MMSRSVSRISRVGVDAPGQEIVERVGKLAPVGVGEGVIDPNDVERAGVALVDEPAEVLRVTDEPEAGDREGDRRVRLGAASRVKKRRSSGRGLGQRSPVTKAPGFAPRVRPAFS